MRSQSNRSPAAAVQQWELTRATDFAITTVNVPDRLDLQEVRARADEDDEAPRRRLVFDTYGLRVWFTRLLVVGILGAIAYFGYLALLPLRDDVSPAGIAARLTQGLGLAVRVAGTELRLTPTPRLVVTGVDVGGAYQLGEVSLHFNWDDALRALRGGSWLWGEAAVAPLKLDAAQGLALLKSLDAAAVAIPPTISTIRFESIELTGMPLLPNRYEVVARRGPDGRFTPARLSEIGVEGRMKLTVVARHDRDWGDVVEFQLDAANWALPVGPAARWNEVVATGRVRTNLIEVDDYSLSGAFGTVQGQMVAARDVEWAVTGTARAPSLDLEAVLLHVMGGAAEERTKGPYAVPLNGTAVLSLLVAGRGETLLQAIDQSVAAGPLQVRWATLNGVNLGYAATRGGISAGTGGGMTRFSELKASATLGRAGLTVSGIRGRAGAMATRGEIRVAPDLGLSGALRVDLGAQRVQAPLNLRVGGTALQPQFGR